MLLPLSDPCLNDYEYVEVDLYFEELVVPSSPSSAVSDVAWSVDYDAIPLRKGLGDASIPFYDRWDQAYSREARLRDLIKAQTLKHAYDIAAPVTLEVCTFP